MAVLGAQLVITLVMISIIQKLGHHFSFGRWLLCSTGLIRYLYPTDNELKQLANIPKDKAKNKKNKNYANGKTIQQQQQQPETFHIPRNLDVQLSTAKVTHLDVVHLRYYTEYQWIVDFFIYAIIVYTITEVYTIWFPIKDEINLSILWCNLILFFSIKLLLTLTVQYFRGEESLGERSTCIVMAFIYLLISMIVLIVDENMLELGLEQAYASFNSSASVFLSKQGLNTSGPASKIVLKFFTALWCGILGALFTFPGLRVAKMHWDLLRTFRERKFIQILVNINFALPFILVVLWIKPVARHYLTVRLFSGMSEPLLTDDAFETLRIILIVFTMCLKLFLMPWYLQAYLDMAYNRTEEQKKEAGRITNIDLQKKIASIFYYLCVVTLQYILPIIMCLILSLIYKTLGEFSWNGLDNDECPAIDNNNTIDPFTINDNNGSVDQSTVELQLALDGLKSIFTKEVFRGLFGFATWWCCFVYFATTATGLAYQSYFSIN